MTALTQIVRKKIMISDSKKKYYDFRNYLYNTYSTIFREKSQGKMQSLFVQTQELRETKSKSVTEVYSSTTERKAQHYEKGVENKYLQSPLWGVK